MIYLVAIFNRKKLYILWRFLTIKNDIFCDIF